METGAILLLSTDPNVAGEACLANPIRRSGFQAARHNILQGNFGKYNPNDITVVQHVPMTCMQNNKAEKDDD
jgi:hypothetical protein